MKVGIMGGTFDPIHLGHLIAAESAKEGLQLDEIWFIPTHRPPHKEHAPKASSSQRWEMVNHAIRSSPHYRALDIELQREGMSYTMDTAKELNQIHPDKHFYYIIGADMVQYLPHWHRIDELILEISFIGLERAGFEINWELIPKKITDKVSKVPMPMIDISSTVIRNRRSQGQSIRYLVTEDVFDYIEVNKLYES